MYKNHTGYPSGVQGDVLNGTQLKSILEGLKDNELLQDIGHILTGYIGSVSFLLTVIHIVQTIRQQSPGSRYVCDPVLGDNGKFYVPPELVEVYRNEVLPIADVVTPNQFEVEQLTGIKITSMEDALKACQKLHEMGPKLVVITSLTLTNEITESLCESKKEEPASIAILASQSNPAELWRVDSPLVPGTFTGTGDLCASLLLAWTDREKHNLPLALEKVIGTMFSVIRRTSQEFQQLDGDALTPARRVAARELRLVQSKHDIEDPPILYKARRIL